MTKSPLPQGNYKVASRFDHLVFTSGMTPRENGVLKHTGKIDMIEDKQIQKHILRTAMLNALNAIKSEMDEDEKIQSILSFTCFINCQDNFTAHTQIADYASEYLKEELGMNGIGSRAAIGVNSLPSGAPVEIKLIASIM